MATERTDTVASLATFHAGDRDAIERCYRAHASEVLAAAARVLPRVDAETVTHEVFYRLLSDREMRATFHGGSMGPWLCRIATNAAIDLQRRRGKEVAEPTELPGTGDAAPLDDSLSAKLLIDRFCRDHLPTKWRAVFDARFLRQLPQRAAAKELGIERSTLAYQEQQVRSLLRAFLLDTETP